MVRRGARLEPGRAGLREVHMRSLRFLRGSNIHAYMPVMLAVLDIGSYEDRPSSSFPGFTDRLLSWLPGLAEHQCGSGRPGGFISRLHRGTYLPHISEHVAIELQNRIGFDVAFGKTRGTGEPGVYGIVVAYEEEEPAAAAFETAVRLVLAAMHDELLDVADEIGRLRAIANDHRLGPTTDAIVSAARARDIPVYRLTPGESLALLGYGIHQKRIRASETSYTASIAVDLCQDKPLTKRVLRGYGISVPEGRTVTSLKDAWEAAREIGLPVVVKPTDGNQGKGVSAELCTKAELREGYAIARQYGRKVLIERFVEGRDYRLLVVDGKMAAAARRDPPEVVGDGRRTVAELVDELNSDPSRAEGHASALTRVLIDDVVRLHLGRQKLLPTSVIEAGRTVRLRQNANLSTGGTATDVTDDVHPSNVRVAEMAARFLGLDVAGIDVVCRDVSRPLDEQGGAIVEVNAAPGLRMHLNPTHGTGRNVAATVIEMLYPGATPSRVPIVAVTGTNGKTIVTRLIGHICQRDGRVVGMTTTEGVLVDGHRLMRGDCSGPESARTVLHHPLVETAVLETARGGILRGGLAFDRCDVAVVTNVTGDHLGLDGVHTLGDLARVKQVVAEAVRDDGWVVLNAEDPLVARMADAVDGRALFFSMTADNPVLQRHLADGGTGVYVEDGGIVLREGRVRKVLAKLSRLPFTRSGKIKFQVQNALAASAAAHALGVDPFTIRRALFDFQGDSASAPGRFNVLDIGGVQVILDYGHNVAALEAIGQGVDALGKRRTVMVMSLPGDRRDEDLRASIEATRSYVDEYVAYDFADRRGREAGEIYRMVKQLVPGGVPCTSATSQREGFVQTWARVQPGDRVILIPDEVDDALELLDELGIAGEGEARAA